MNDQDDVGFIYVLHGFDDYYKIGKATHLDRRIMQLKVQLPFPVKLVYSDCTSHLTKVESGLHRALARKRKNGEWFRLDEDDLQFIKEVVVYGDYIPA